MKNILSIILYLVLLSLVYSCSEEDNKSNAKIGDLEPIRLNDIRQIIPNQLQTGKAVVYKNESGEFKKLQTFYDEIERDAYVNGTQYTQERLSIFYQDENKSSFAMFLSGVGVYTNELQVQKTISAALMPTKEASCSVLVEVINEEVAISEWSDFNATISIHSGDFNNVFIGRNDFNTTGKYDQIMFNQDVGVVAFKDDEGELWVFDSFD